MRNKLALERAKDIEKTRRILKQFLYALHVSEGFGQERLMRVLIEWSEIYDDVNNNKADMHIIDAVLDEVCPSHMITKSIGKEKL